MSQGRPPPLHRRPLLQPLVAPRQRLPHSAQAGGDEGEPSSDDAGDRQPRLAPPHVHTTAALLPSCVGHRRSQADGSDVGFEPRAPLAGIRQVAGGRLRGAAALRGLRSAQEPGGDQQSGRLQVERGGRREGGGYGTGWRFGESPSPPLGAPQQPPQQQGGDGAMMNVMLAGGQQGCIDINIFIRSHTI